jgi:hypothetical protein
MYPRSNIPVRWMNLAPVRPHDNEEFRCPLGFFDRE